VIKHSLILMLPAIFLASVAGASDLNDTLAPPSNGLAKVGEQVFKQHCQACHDPAIERAPNRADLAARPREAIVNALTTGIMVPMAQGLAPEQIQAVAAYLHPGETAAAAGQTAPVELARKYPLCSEHPPIVGSRSDWTSTGLDARGTRYQANPGIKYADVAKLKVKWSFAMVGGAQPTVVGDWLFITNRSGEFYALDANTGCVHWVVEDAPSRTTPVVVRSNVAPSGWATVIGIRGLGVGAVRAYDAKTGQKLWDSGALESNPLTQIVAAPVVDGDQVFVPMSTGEEVAAMRPDYACCSARGSVTALDLKTGKKLWQTHVITEPLRATGTNAVGVEIQGPAGGAVWSTPTVDAERGLVYAVTGNSYTDVDTKGTNAVVAFDMKSGAIRWSTQVTAADNFIMGCWSKKKGVNCPNPLGRDVDFGASPLLFGSHGKRQVLVAADKASNVYGLDPSSGKLLWTVSVGSGGSLGGVEWGIGADHRHVYVPNSDVTGLQDEVLRPMGKPKLPIKPSAPQPGLNALDPFTGRLVWSRPAPVAPCKYAGDRSKDFALGACIRAQSAAPAVMPGVVFSGTMDGWLRAYDAASGDIIWAFSTTAIRYNTVNGVMGQPGGNIDGMGPTIANGMVYTMSGKIGAASTGSNDVNVLLAFSVNGR
jgi:polyvinyl alcohol dehydrogenase (cytochrome)